MNQSEPYVDLQQARIQGLLTTLRHAQQASPYYSEILADLCITEENLLDALHTLPILQADEWAAARARIRTAPISPDSHIGFTSGTTGLLPKPFLESAEERQAMESLDAVLSSDESGVALNLYGSRHGVPAAHAGSSTISVPLETPLQFEQVLHMLSRSREPYSSFPRISRIVGMLLNIKKLTVELRQRGIDPRDFGVTELIVFTQVLTPRWRARLEETWGATVREMYGFSEMRIATAARCATCAYFHMPPWTFAECLDTRTGEVSAAPGFTGSIVLSAFFPFKQLEPRLRYRPGDIVRVAEDICPELGEPGFEVLGRETRSVWSDSARTWVTTRQVLNALDDLWEINRVNPRTFESKDLHDVECGTPRFQLESSGGKVTLTLELRFDPEFWPAATERIAASVHAELGTLIDRIEFRGPGELPFPALQI